MSRTLVALAALAGCVGGVCYPQAFGVPQGAAYRVVAPPPPAPVKRWIDCDFHDGRGTVQVLGWYDAQGYVQYWPAENRHLERPPVPPPAKPAAPAPPPPKSEPPAKAREAQAPPTPPAAHVSANFGLDLSQLHHRGQPESYQSKGDEAHRMVQEATAPGRRVEAGPADDQDERFLSVIGAADVRAKALAELQAQGLTDKVHVGSFDPEAWQVTSVGLPTEGRPAVILQEPDGQVVHRLSNYPQGVEQLAAKLRKPNPLYDPKRDPGVADAPALGASWRLLVLVGCVLLILTRGKSTK
jgi:hypothetical protein